MQEQDMRQLIEQVRVGALPRRRFIHQMVGLGLSAPMASMLLMHAGVAQAQSLPEYKPTKRGGGGPLKMLYWQGPTNLNPHFAVGIKDMDAARLFYEPLAAWDEDGNLVPILAAEIPSRANGGLAADGKSVVWKLKKGVKWHDGKPFTADDCVFNWEYARDPGTAAGSTGLYREIQVTKIDDYTIKITFKIPTPFWALAFVGSYGALIPKHLFSAYIGAKSLEAPNNSKPVGTGPYKFVDFKPGDMLRGVINKDYHIPARPHFDTVELKGGGDAVSAARAVLQTGEFDFAANLQVEDEILKRLESTGKGRTDIVMGGALEFVVLNYADPNKEIDGERSSPKSRHPCFSDPAVRQAMGLLVDRQSIQSFIYGRTGIATANVLNFPVRYRSSNIKMEFNIDKANAILDAAGWKKGSDGVREKNGNKLKFVYQTSVNGPRQKTQAIIKQACQKAGIEVELQSLAASVFFSSDTGNLDTSSKFFADMETFTITQSGPDPERFMGQFVTSEVASKANKWQGRNYGRWRSEEFDKVFAAVGRELDPVKRAALLIQCNDLVCLDRYFVPIVSRPMVHGVINKLATPLSGWDATTWAIQSWYREA